MRRRSSIVHQATGRTSSLEFGVTGNRKIDEEDDKYHSLQILPEYQLQPIPSTSAFHTLPSQRASAGFIDRYPRIGNSPALNTHFVQYFPDHEGEIGDVMRPESRSMLRTCLVLGSCHKRGPPKKQATEEPTEVRKRDDSFKISSWAQEPLNYPFLRMGKRRRSYLLYCRDGGKGEVPNGQTKPPATASENGKTGFQQASSSVSITASTSLESSATPPYSPEDVGKPRSHRPTHSKYGWSELTEVIGPLPWPLLNVDTNAFSSQPEFRPFLSPNSEEE